MKILKQISLFILSFFTICFVDAMDQPSCDWVQDALSSRQSGTWIINDKSGKTVVVDGEMMSKDLQPKQFKAVLESGIVIVVGFHLEDLASMYADVMQPLEFGLAGASMTTRLWNRLEMIYYWKSRYRDILYDFYVRQIGKILSQKSTEPSYIFTVSERQADGEKLLLGSVIFGIKKDFAYANIEVSHLVVKPEAQGRGLDMILASSIFKLLPQIERIFVEADCRDARTICLYESLKFEKCAELVHRVLYEYLVAKEYLNEPVRSFRKDSFTLREVAAGFQDISERVMPS